MAKFLRLTGWDKYQHYKQRNPPWIKLHRSILQSHAFILLDDASKLLAFVCIVLAGDSNNMIPLDRDFIQTRAGLQKRPDIRPLIKSGFAEIFEDCKQVASEMLADASKLRQNCPSEKETYKQETEKETDCDIGADEATTKIFLEVGLAGNEARMLVHDAVKAFVHHSGGSFADAAGALIAAWQEYEKADIQFKKGVFKFFKEGLWKGSWKTGKSEWDPDDFERRMAQGKAAAQ